MFPRVVVNLEKLDRNIQTVVKWCDPYGIQVAFVGKCICEDEVILSSVDLQKFAAIADSRIENLKGLKLSIPRLLLRIGMPDQAEDIIKYSEISLQSELTTLKALNDAAEIIQKVHKVILMIDLGDLREGIFYKDFEKILKTAEYIKQSTYLELYGVGTNLTCYGSIVPDERNMKQLAEIRDRLQGALSIRIPVVAGGNSSSLALVRSGKMPDAVNYLRVGEAILLGTDTSTGLKFSELCSDAFTLEAELVEIQDKPSYPIGTISVDAFGHHQEYTDRGIMHRGIVAIGKQDVPIDGIIPADPRIEIVGGSSDHIILNLNQRTDLAVGDIVRFNLNYGGLLGAFTSRYVSVEYIHSESKMES